MLDRLQQIWVSKPRYNDFVRVIGHVVLTLGFGMALEPTVRALPAYAILGAVVGVMIVMGRPGTILGDSMPIVAAFTVTVLTGTLLDWAVHDDAVRVITPPLISFLPGLVLTIAAIELTHGQVIAGASRLVYGLSRLVTLAFGLVAGIAVVGPISPHPATEQLGWWAPLVGVLLTALGYTLFSGAPKGSLPWFVLVLFLVLAAQRIGSQLLSPELSGFVGRADHHPPHARDRAGPEGSLVGGHDAARALDPRARCARLHRHQRGRDRRRVRARLAGQHGPRHVRDLARGARRFGHRPRRHPGQVDVEQHRVGSRPPVRDDQLPWVDQWSRQGAAPGRAS